MQAQNNHLLKLGKAVTEEKEQLEHTAIKVKNDLDDMKAKYQETASTVNDLISGLGVLVGEGEHHLEVEGDRQDLTQAKVARLKKLMQLASVQLERTDTKLKAKLAEIDRKKEDLQQNVRYLYYYLCMF